MDFVTEMNRHILASAILNVDVTEVCSPIRANKLAAKFGLVLGSSLDLANEWEFEEPGDRLRAWRFHDQDAICDCRISAMHVVQ